MGQLLDKKIVQSRIWHDPNVDGSIPPWDYDFSYPITVYDAVQRSMDDNTVTLADELESIYRQINEKQQLIPGGRAGYLMTWSGKPGEIDETEIVTAVNQDPVQRSHSKVPSERAVGNVTDKLATKAELKVHTSDSVAHVTEEDRLRWDHGATVDQLREHIENTEVHITESERESWNNKADASDFEDHITNMRNPHNVTAHQVGTYTNEEIDDRFANIHESFFGYVNIQYDERSGTATLVSFSSENWNPNYVLGYQEELPTITDDTLTYFALAPATEYSTNPTNECLIYIKLPGAAWQVVGRSEVSNGILVIRNPDTAMYVWMDGRFHTLLTANADDDPGTGQEPGVWKSTLMWRPTVDKDGTLGWTRSESFVAPDPVNIMGPPGYTPIKGIDYHDGADGIGIPTGGELGDVLRKSSIYDYDTEWVNIDDMIRSAIEGGLPSGLVTWDTLEGRPQVYDELGDSHTDLITQAAATSAIHELTDQITKLMEVADGDVPLSELTQMLQDHITNFANPHKITPSLIGAPSTEEFEAHINAKTNPHRVTKEQIGLSNVDNTSDMDKPISTLTQLALQDLLDRINAIDNSLIDENLVTDVAWDPHTTTLKFFFRDDTELDVVLPIVEIFQQIYYDQEEKELVIVLPDGSANRIDISTLIKLYLGSQSDTIKVTTDGNVIKAELLQDSVNGYHLIESIILRGSPTTSTQKPEDRSTRIATTEFVKSTVIDNLISFETDRPLSANMGRILNNTKADIEDVIEIIQNIEGLEVIDDLNSANSFAALSANMGRLLNLTKAPRVHTSPSGSTFGRASIDYFGHARASSTDPKMDGEAELGTDDGYYARADHRHPTDSSRAPVHFPDTKNNIYKLTGEPKAETPPSDSNDDRIATTEWVRENCRVKVDYLQGECRTASTDANKLATITNTDVPNFELYDGLVVNIKWHHKDMPGDTRITTLNVNNTGAYPVLFAGVYMHDGWLGKNSMHQFVFENNFWWLINPIPFAVKPEHLEDHGPGTPGIWPGEDDRYDITFDPQGGEFTYIPDQRYDITFDPQGGDFTYIPSQIYNVTFDPQDGYFTYIPDQIYDVTFDPQGGYFTYIPNRTYNITFDPQGGYFIYIPKQTYNVTFDPQDGYFTYVPNQTFNITFDPQEGIFTYIPTRECMITFDEQEGTFTYVPVQT